MIRPEFIFISVRNFTFHDRVIVTVTASKASSTTATRISQLASINWHNNINMILNQLHIAAVNEYRHINQHLLHLFILTRLYMLSTLQAN